MVLAREISARWTAKSNISPATPATAHNRRGSPWSEVNARTSRREFRKPPSMRLSLYEPAPSRLCSRIRCRARHLTASRSSRSSKHKKLGAERQCTKFGTAACATVAYADKPRDGSWRRVAISLVDTDKLAAALETGLWEVGRPLQATTLKLAL